MNVYEVSRVNSFEKMFLQIRQDLYDQTPTHVGEWQSQKIEMPMLEMLHVVFDMPIPPISDPQYLGQMLGARVPWAEDHFLERVGGEPLNPSPSEAWWPFAQKKDSNSNADYKSEGAAFSHTYPERMWPKAANGGKWMGTDALFTPHWGIRFEYGDLNDVVMQLFKSPMTRQAYLPIWFPEDTGAVHGKRVPCTLGYHFIIRDGKLDISYFMRSTDLLRHFQDDIYLAIRLAQWLVEQLNEWHWGEGHPPERAFIEVGTLVFHTANMHIFEGDKPLIDYWKTQGKSWF